MKIQVNHRMGIGKDLMPGQVLTDDEVAALREQKAKNGRSMLDVYLASGALFETAQPMPVRVREIGPRTIGGVPPNFEKGLEPGRNIQLMQELAGAAKGEPDLSSARVADLPGADVMDDSDLGDLGAEE